MTESVSFDFDLPHPPEKVWRALTDPALLAGFPTEHGTGGPYVMYAGTPYAHLMVPVVGDMPH